MQYMGEQTNTITINGSTYEIGTGKNLGQSRSASKSIDGFFQAGSTVKPTAHKAEPHISAKSKPHAARQPNKTHRKTQTANTLMRGAVKKPVFARPSKAQGAAHSSQEFKVAVRDVSYKENISDMRKKRAENVSRSKHISRFGEPKEQLVVKKTEKLEVKAAPEENVELHHESLITQSIVEPIKTAESLFADALSNATSHEQPNTKKSKKHDKKHRSRGKRRLVRATAVVAFVAVLGGFVLYQNSTKLALKAASSKAGIHASLPGYKPSGFAVDRNVQSSPGTVTLTYSSNSDSRNFKVTQATSDWNSDTLYDSFVASTGQPYEKVDTKTGQAIFLYGDSNATWVDGGIWYKVEGNSGLTSDQLLQLANSL